MVMARNGKIPLRTNKNLMNDTKPLNLNSCLCVCVSTVQQLGFRLWTSDFFVIWTVFISVLTTICKVLRTPISLLTGFLFELHFYEVSQVTLSNNIMR